MKKMMVFLVVLGLLLFGCTTETSQQCGSDRAEVCGSDGVTYTNECYAKAAGATISHTGACTGPQGGSTAALDCVDSDSGKNALESGTASKGSESFSDSCSPTSNSVFEYYCANNAITSESVPCPAGTECAAGKCGEVLCSDSDGGQNEDVKGTAKKGSDSSTDNCSSSTSVLEFYCSNNQILSKVISCGTGRACEGGGCVVSECRDTDGGFNLYQKGTTEGASGITYVDVCTGANGITEYYCTDGNVFHTTADCGDTYTCSSGACIETMCRETDSGEDEDTYGTVSVEGSEYDDECYDEETVNEYYCSGVSVANKRINCDSDERCMDGECTSDYCVDSDGGKDKDEYGTVEVGGEGSWSDYCQDGNTVKEYYCSGSSEEQTNMDCDSGEVCSGGECVKEADCSETDGGKDEYTKGTTTQGSNTGTDYCIGEFVLKEYFCSGDVFDYDNIECQSDEVCASGKCVEAKCADSDGGKDYFEEGTVTKGQDGYTDYCSGSNVIEYYCELGEIEQITHSCGTPGCDDGACVGIVR